MEKLSKRYYTYSYEEIFSNKMISHLLTIFQKNAGEKKSGIDSFLPPFDQDQPDPEKR